MDSNIKESNLVITEPNKEKLFEIVLVSSLKPGDKVETYKGQFFIKNIYLVSNDVTPVIIEVYGKCVTIEFTTDIKKCNMKYKVPEARLNSLADSEMTPSIFPLNDKIKRYIK